MILSVFRSKKYADAVHKVYVSLVNQSRRKLFYGQWGVPDTVNGRFDMISLHLCLIFRRLKKSGKAGKDFSQELFDLFFKDMDRSLREMGAGDMAVPKRIQKMGELFYGMLASLDSALDDEDTPAVRVALSRNIYDGEDVPALDKLVTYVQNNVLVLEQQDEEHILSGNLTFDTPFGDPDD